MAFIPEDFQVPEYFINEKFVLQPLSPKFAELDFQAIVSSSAFLKGTFGPGNSWPPDNMNFEENKSDLSWHYKNFLKRKEFAYIVLDPDKSMSMGCIYILPPHNDEFDAIVFFWVTEIEAKKGFENILQEFLLSWLTDVWPFENITFPGRIHTWETWTNP